MKAYSDATKRFLLAAKHAEINALQQLSTNCRVVSGVSKVIHQLQRERGVTNIYLASRHERFAMQRQQQIEASNLSESQLRSLLKSQFLTGHESALNMRLLNSITFALQGMDNLSVLREQAETLNINVLQSTQAYCRLIAGLLTVVFEAADVASDPMITRLLVSLFNFMQGKEYAGQERAWGAIGFAETHFDKNLCARLSQLQSAQSHNFEIFCEFANQEECAKWQDVNDSDAMADLYKLRTMIQKLSDGAPIAAEISEIWYDTATRRIDHMHKIEEALAQNLLAVANQQVENANNELFDHKKHLKTLENNNRVNGSPYTMLFDPNMPGLIGEDTDLTAAKKHADELSAHRSFYDLLKGQSERIKRMSQELEEAKRAITEQKAIDRAKLLIMQQMQVTEAQAYRKLQKSAMEQNTRIYSIAESILQGISRS
jgi:hypothetical protein